MRCDWLNLLSMKIVSIVRLSNVGVRLANVEIRPLEM